VETKGWEMKYFIQQTAIGRIGIAETDGKLSNVWFEADPIPVSDDEQKTGLIQQAFDQLQAYLAGEQRGFTLPLYLHGTEFQIRVWERLQDIPYGQTVSYKDLAGQVGNPSAVRAVGATVGRNPLPLFVPCHRVIGSNGLLTGYRGGLEIKKHLLELERDHRSD
jgi:methylated-DNA-[protein]-cysteine S-methyltransferase